MSNRNFILLIIILSIVLLIFFGFLFSRRDVVSPEEEPGGTNFFSQFNPFAGGGLKPGGNKEPIELGEDRGEPEGKPLSMIKVSSVPVAGYGVFLKERYKEELPVPPPVETTEQATPVKPTPPATEFAPALRYVDRATGQIYQTFADKIEERKFSVTQIPKVYEAFFGNNAQSVIMRYLKSDGRTIETFFANLPKEILGGDIAGEIEVRGSLLPINVTDVSISGDGAGAFYLYDTGETTLGSVLDFSSAGSTQVFDSSYNEWLSQWPGGKTVMLTTKPSYLSPGFMYKVDTVTKNFSQVLGNIIGLTALSSPDGKKVLYSDNTLSLNLYNTDTKIAVSLGLRTLPEKCAWGKSGVIAYCMAPKLVVGQNFPDAWYQGEISFDDQLWVINSETGTASILFDPAALVDTDVDGIKLTLDSGEKYLFFVNKKDSYLWEVRLP